MTDLRLAVTGVETIDHLQTLIDIARAIGFDATAPVELSGINAIATLSIDVDDLDLSGLPEADD